MPTRTSGPEQPLRNDTLRETLTDPEAGSETGRATYAATMISQPGLGGPGGGLPVCRGPDPGPGDPKFQLETVHLRVERSAIFPDELFLAQHWLYRVS